MTTFLDVSLIALAGAMGALCRYATGLLSNLVFGNNFPFGTLIVNVVGCFILGLIMANGTVNEAIPKAMRIPLTIGFLGAFTTFSTFGYDTIRLFEANSFNHAALNVGANLFLGLSATVFGIWLGRSVFA